jgi:hypothetical protein
LCRRVWVRLCVAVGRRGRSLVWRERWRLLCFMMMFCLFTLEKKYHECTLRSTDDKLRTHAINATTSGWSGSCFFLCWALLSPYRGDCLSSLVAGRSGGLSIIRGRTRVWLRLNSNGPARGRSKTQSLWKEVLELSQ